MQNMLTMSTKPKDVADALKECKIGEEKTITLVVVPTKHEGGVFEAKIKSLENVDYGDDSEESDEAEPVTAKPMKSKGGEQYGAA